MHVASLLPYYFGVRFSLCLKLVLSESVVCCLFYPGASGPEFDWKFVKHVFLANIHMVRKVVLENLL